MAPEEFAGVNLGTQSARRRHTTVKVSGGRAVIQCEPSGVFVSIDDNGAQSHVAVLERGFAKIHRNNLVPVGAGAREFAFVRVHLVSHG